MSKSTAAKQWFYSLGFRSINPDYIGPLRSQIAKEWAQLAYDRGAEDGRWARARNTTKQWPTQKLVDSLGASHG